MMARAGRASHRTKVRCARAADRRGNGDGGREIPYLRLSASLCINGLHLRPVSAKLSPLLLPKPLGDALVCVVDDDDSIRRSLARLFRSARIPVETFAAGKAFLERAPHEGPCCLVLDVRMPGLDGIALQRALADRDAQIIFLTGHGDVPMCADAMKAGAVDFLTKPVDDELLLSAVHRGLERSMAVRKAVVDRTSARALLAALTPREFEVMQRVIAGLLNKQIADELGASEKTVKIHRGRVMGKMAVTSVASLVRVAQAAGVAPLACTPLGPRSDSLASARTKPLQKSMQIPTLIALAVLATALPLNAQTAQIHQLKTITASQRQRVDLLREETKQTDVRIEARLDAIMTTLKSIADSKDSRTKVARMKEETGKRLGKTISYYDQKRAALREELRNPRLHLTAEEKQKLIAIFDERIEKRTQQILALNQSMPAHEDHERYRATGSGWHGTEYERNAEFEQNRRMTSKNNTQRDAIVKQLDASIARLDRQTRTLQGQLAATTDPAWRKTVTDEIAKTNALIAERRQQRLETLKPAATATHTIALKEAMDLDKALQTATNDLRRDFTTLFERYHTFLQELSALHATEASLASATARQSR